MNQKALKNNSSETLIVLKKPVRELGLKSGDSVILKTDKIKKVVVIERVSVDRELLNWTDGFIKKYRGALESLANK